MKRGRLLLFFPVLVGAASATSACFDYLSDHRLYLQDPGSDVTGGGGGTGGGTTTTTLPPGCIPSNVTEPIEDACGVFVSSSTGDDANEGTKDAPLRSIAAALGAAKGGAVYLCGEVFAEAVELKAGALIYGGLDCSAGWAYAADKRAVVQAPADAIGLRVAAKVSAELADVEVVAADATLPGGSSIALLAEADADVVLVRAALRAGNGANGADGEAFDMPAMGGSDGLPGADACSGPVTIGGLSIKNTCDAEESVSGAGGIGQELSGGPGGPGLPDGAMNGGAGEGGSACTMGTTGDDGAPGAAGAGASGLGSLGVNGLSSVAGGDGQPGKVAQGGGGGGGAKGGAAGAMMMDAKQCGAVANAMGTAGASGGSGGAGGCGGAGGKGGGAGGSSIGVVSLGASFTFDGVSITTKAGGKGGNGGSGQLGGPGGNGGAGGTVPAAATALKPGCGGGAGGNGGAGGRGGGGLGGHSVGIAHTGEVPSIEGAQITIGAAGNGGAGEGMMGNGAAGVAAQARKF